MSKLKINRERLNLTQEELSDQSGISVRTIQRIESGNEPKGQTLKILAKTLGVGENELLDKEEAQVNFDGTFYKIMNISSLPFTLTGMKLVSSVASISGVVSNSTSSKSTSSSSLSNS